MKNLTLCMLSLGLIPLSLACSLANGPELVQQTKDIQFFVKQATRIALHETQASDHDVAVLKSYMEAAHSLLQESGPDISQLRELVVEALPEQYHLVALTVIDVIERYALSVLENPDENQAALNQLIISGLKGAMAALDEN